MNLLKLLPRYIAFCTEFLVIRRLITSAVEISSVKENIVNLSTSVIFSG
jgi:hypothetical protein